MNAGEKQNVPDADEEDRNSSHQIVFYLVRLIVVGVFRVNVLASFHPSQAETRPPEKA